MRIDAKWVVQPCFPLDYFNGCTLTIEQWLNAGGDPPFDSVTLKWEAIMHACAVVLPFVDSEDGLRHEPRVGFDPGRDQTFFIFKASNNGTTFLVAQQKLALPLGNEIEGYRLR